MTWKVYLENSPEWGTTRLHMANLKGHDGRVDIVQPLILKTVEQGVLLTGQSGLLGDTTREECKEFLRSLMDAAWDIGIRPIKFTDHTNELTAIRYHLEDMRTLSKLGSRK